MPALGCNCSAGRNYGAHGRCPPSPGEETSALNRAATRLRTTLLSDWRAARALEPAWEALLERCPDSSVFQTLPWHRAWWQAFGAGHGLCLILAYAGTHLVGIAPMMMLRERSAFGRPRLGMHFIGSTNHASDYCDFITDPKCPHALDALVEEMAGTGCRRYELSHLPGWSRHRTRLVSLLRAQGLRTFDDVQNDAPVRLLGHEAADREAVNKSSLKRNKRYFEKLGELRFCRLHRTGEVLANLDAFFQQHIARWANTTSRSQFLDPRQREFYRELVRCMHSRHWLTFDVLTLDGEPLAFHVGFEYRRRFIWYKPTFDVSYAPKSPGQVLIKYLLETAIERRLEEFDFTVGSEGFKHRFANRVRHIHRVSAFRSAVDYLHHRAITGGKRSLSGIRHRIRSSLNNAGATPGNRRP